MIKETNDINMINYFLSYFDTEFCDNPFRKYVVYDNKAILIYSKIYERLEIDYLYVLDDFRNQGIASKLLDYLFLKENISCSLEVKCDNYAAISLYKKFKFEVVAVREKYYQDKDGYLMVRK